MNLVLNSCLKKNSNLEIFLWSVAKKANNYNKLEQYLIIFVFTVLIHFQQGERTFRRGVFIERHWIF